MKDPITISSRVFILIIADSTRDTMVIDLTLIVNLQIVHVGRREDVVEGLDEVEEQPDIDHLDVSRLGKIVADIDEHGCEDQHCGDIDRYNRLKEELLEVVGRVTDKIEDNCGCKHS